MRLPCAVYTALILMSFPLRAGAQPPARVSVPDRARGADRIVVAQVTDVSASYETNQYGDQLIVSHAHLLVEETLKGNAERGVDLDVVGGTLNGLTLDVSHEPKISRGDRAVFFITSSNGKNVPHLHDLGVLTLDAHNHVKGSSVDLDAIKQLVAAASGR